VLFSLWGVLRARRWSVGRIVSARDKARHKPNSAGCPFRQQTQGISITHETHYLRAGQFLFLFPSRGRRNQSFDEERTAQQLARVTANGSISKSGERTTQRRFVFVVYPERKDKAPVVLVVHEIFGHWTIGLSAGFGATSLRGWRDCDCA
jgi:hypothetical protein